MWMMVETIITLYRWLDYEDGKVKKQYAYELVFEKEGSIEKVGVSQEEFLRFNLGDKIDDEYMERVFGR